MTNDTLNVFWAAFLSVLTIGLSVTMYQVFFILRKISRIIVLAEKRVKEWDKVMESIKKFSDVPIKAISIILKTTSSLLRKLLKEKKGVANE